MPVVADPEGVRLTIRVTPRAKANKLTGVIEDADGRPLAAIRLAAPPVDGAANKALIAFLAAELGVSRSSVTLLAGDTGRRKTVAIAGIDEADVRTWLACALA